MVWFLVRRSSEDLHAQLEQLHSEIRAAEEEVKRREAELENKVIDNFGLCPLS